MKDFFEGIQTIFEDYLFEPLNDLREYWNWTAGGWQALVNWLFIIMVIAAFIYWMRQLKKFNDRMKKITILRHTLKTGQNQYLF